MSNVKFAPSAAAHAREEQPQAYFLLRALYNGPNHRTLYQLCLRAGIAPDTGQKRPRYWRALVGCCTRDREKKSGPYVYSRIPGMTRDQALRKFKGLNP